VNSNRTVQAETRPQPALVKSISLDITIDDFNQHRDALLLNFSAQYGVDPSLVTLEAAPGSVQLTLTIATTNGTSAPVPIAELAQAVERIDDATLAASIGAVMGTSVTVSSQNATMTSVLVTIETTCSKGRWCTAGEIIDCTPGTYNDLTGQTDARACQPCPPYSSSPAASTDVTDCACQADRERRMVNGTVECLCTAGFQLNLVNDACQACPVGTYKTTAGNSACTSCPLKSPTTNNKDATTRGEGATAATDCTCPIGTFANISSAQLANGSALFACVPCESVRAIASVKATECNRLGVALDSLPVAVGMWRQSSTSLHVRRCATLSSGGVNGTYTTCLGGDISAGDAQCAKGYKGPLCELCEAQYYGGKGASCTACPSSPVTALLLPLGALAAALVLIGGLLVRYRRKGGLSKLVRRVSGASMTVMDNAASGGSLRTSLASSAKSTMKDAVVKEIEKQEATSEEEAAEKRRARRLRKLGALAQSCGVKLRILIALYQVLSQLGVTFAITHPTFYSQMIASVSSINLNVDMLPLACIARSTEKYYFELLANTICPMVLVALCAGTSAALKRCATRARHRNAASGQTSLILSEFMGDCWFYSNYRRSDANPRLSHRH
jgi:hypothetical protein